jgi:hypothetical protein
MPFFRKVIQGGGIHHEHLQDWGYKYEDPVFTVQKTIKALVEDGHKEEAFDILCDTPLLTEGRKSHLAAVLFPDDRSR